MPMVEVWPGHAYPLGATYDGSGTNFSLFSEVATGVELCLFDDDGAETRVPLTEQDGHVWHGYLPTVGPGQRYGYRVHGPYDPERGLRCNPNKLLVDPYAKAIDGQIHWHESLFDYHFADPGRVNNHDSAPYVPTCVVVSPFFDWGAEQHPNIPYHETVIYEAHVRGMTIRHPDVPPPLRGTYAGMAHPAIIEHLLSLGVTAVELMPIHHFLPEHALVARGLTNYWGYNTLAFFAPHSGYAATGTRGSLTMPHSMASIREKSLMVQGKSVPSAYPEPRRKNGVAERSRTLALIVFETDSRPEIQTRAISLRSAISSFSSRSSFALRSSSAIGFSR